MSSRDFAILAYAAEEKDNKNVISVISVEHPDIPPVKKVVRAEIIVAGWCFEKVKENLYKATYISCVQFLFRVI